MEYGAEELFLDVLSIVIKISNTSDTDVSIQILRPFLSQWECLPAVRTKAVESVNGTNVNLIVRTYVFRIIDNKLTMLLF